jgi:hypothetical protein
MVVIVLILRTVLAMIDLFTLLPSCEITKGRIVMPILKVEKLRVQSCPELNKIPS